MSAPSNIIGIAREQTIFAVLETTKGVLAFPTALSPQTVAAGFAEIGQNPTYTDSEEVKLTRDLLEQFQDMCPAGTFSIPLYARPAGAAGSAPDGDVIFQSLLGQKTVNNGVSVVYSPALTKPSFSLWILRGNTVFFGAGCVAETLKITATNKGAVKFQIGGSFLQMGWCGRDAVQVAAASGANTVEVYDANKYSIGAVLQNSTQNDFAADGYTVTGVNPTTNTLTVSPALDKAWNVGDVLQPYLPTGVTVGAPLESRKTGVAINAVSKILTSLDLSYEDKVKVLDDEITTSGFSGDYVENVRKITGTVKSHFRQNDVDEFVSGFNGTQQPILCTFGTVAGSILQVFMQSCKLHVPTVTANAPVLDLSVDFAALGVNGEDSISFTWM
jgi:hypothetical protein